MDAPDRQPHDGIPLLEYLGSGTQNHVFGAENWVVAVPHRTVLSMLARLVKPREGLCETLAHLGGLVTPFLLLDRCRFLGVLPGSNAPRVFELRCAVVRHRVHSGNFLDARLANAEPARALDYLESMVALLERLHARGFHMLDFITRNFVFVGETLRISDPGLVIPVQELSWHPSRFTALGFGVGLTRDYLRLLAELEQKANDGETRARIRAFGDRFPSRIRALRQRRREIEHAEWRAVDFPESLEKDIRTTIGICP